MNTTQDYALIRQVLDRYFDFMNEIGGNSFITELIPASMIDTSRQSKYQDISYWLPLPGTVTDDDATELETFYGHSLPDSYKFFLRQRHFVELYLGGNISFFSNFPGQLTSTHKEIVEDRFQELPDRHYLPFAFVEDHGVLCFNANTPSPIHDYPIVLFYHDDGYTDEEFYAKNFLNMFKAFDAQLQEWIKHKREIGL